MRNLHLAAGVVKTSCVKNPMQAAKSQVDTMNVRRVQPVNGRVLRASI